MLKRILCMAFAWVLLCSCLPLASMAEPLQALTPEQLQALTAPEETQPVPTDPQALTPSQDSGQLRVQQQLVQLPAAGSVVAEGTCGEQVNWSLDENGTLTISGTGPMTNYSRFNLPWVNHLTAIKQVVVSQGVTTISPYAFHNCDNLASVTLPEGLTQIGSNAFAWCAALKEIALPASLERVGTCAFQGSYNLSRVHITDIAAWCQIQFDENNANPLSEAGALYMDGEVLTHLVIPEGVTRINAFAFYELRSITAVTIPASLTAIEESAFDNADNLKQVYISDLAAWCRIDFADIEANPLGNFSSYGNQLFLNGQKVTDLVIPGDITHINKYAFATTNELRSVTFQEGVTSIGNAAFGYCPDLRSVSFPASLTVLDEKAFASCEVLDTVTFAGDAPEMASDAFLKVVASFIYPEKTDAWLDAMRFDYGGTPSWYCNAEGLEGELSIHSSIRWTLKDGVLTITGNGNVSVPYNETFPWDPYRAMICEVIMDGQFQQIGPRAFKDCYRLTKVTFGTGLRTMFGGVFANCTSLRTIDIPETVHYMEDGIFSGCINLESVNIPVGVDCIFGASFANCTSLTSLVIPSTVESVYGAVFEGCTNLKAVYFTGNMPDFSNETFYIPSFRGWKGIVYYPAGNKTWTKDKIKFLENYYPAGQVTCLPYEGTDAPVLKAQADSTGFPLLTWNPVEGIDRYVLWRATSKNGNYTKVAELTENAYLDAAAQAGKTYYYKVQGLCDAQPAMNTPLSTAVSAACRCPAPVLHMAADEATGKQVLTWNQVDGAKKYELYRATSQNGKYSKVTTTTKLTYTDSKASVGTVYFYKVRALASSSTYNSSYSEILSGFAICAQPKVKLTLDSTSGKPQLTWSKITGAAEYRIARRLGDSEEFEILAVQKGTSYTDKTALVDVAYTYTVQAVGKKAETASVPSAWITGAAACGKPGTPKYTHNENGKTVISWEAVEGAAGYNIYRSTSSSKSYKLIATVSELTYTDTDSYGGKTYYYKVSTLGQNSESGQSSYVKATGKCDMPLLTVKPGTSGKPQLTWNKISGAKKYEIWRSVDGAAFKKLTTTTKTTYTDTKAAEGAECTYKVKALGSKSSYNGNFSATGSCYVTCAAPTLTAKVDTATGKSALSWKKVTGAISYDIYRSINGGTFVKLTNVTGTSYLDNTGAADTTYTYYIVAVGKAEVFNSIASGEKTVSVTVGQPKPTGTVNETGKAVLTWNAVEDALNYEIYRSTSSSKSYKLIATVPALTYTDTDIYGGKTYYYKVVAVGTNTKSAQSAYVKLTGKCDIPVLTVKPGTSGKPQLTWNKISGAKKYEIWRSVDGAAFKKLTTTTKTSYTDTKATGSLCEYRVKALGSKSSYNGNFSADQGCYVALSAPSVTVTLNASRKPSLTWKSVTGAVGYAIYRSEGGGAYTLLTTVTTTAYTDQTATIGKYSYQVVALAKESVSNSAASSAKSVSILCAAPKVTGSHLVRRPILTWEPVKDAQAYVIYRSTKSGSGYQKIVTTTANTYMDDTGTYGKTYYYKVAALANGCESTLSNYVKLKITEPYTPIHEDPNQAVVAGAVSGGAGLAWEITDDGVLTLSGTGRIWEGISKYPWQDYEQYFTKVVLKDNVKILNHNVFSQNSNITQVVLGNGLRQIGNSAFSQCTGLTEITLPESLESIGSAAFTKCENLHTVVYPHNSNLQSIGSYAFSGTAITEFIAPYGLLTIGTNAFYQCPVLETVVLEGTVRNVGKDAFKYCYTLQSITLGDTVENPGVDLFFTAGSAKAVYDYTGVAGSYARMGSLNSVVIGGKKDASPVFTDCAKLESVIIEAPVTVITDSAFQGCTALKQIILPDTVTVIEREAFNRSGLTAITIPKSVTSIGQAAFRDAAKLKEVTFLGDMPTIHTLAFKNCVLTIYYPKDNPTWTEDARAALDSTITWIAQ